MDLPIKFPSDAEVIAEEVARFRSLPPVERVRTVAEMVGLCEFLLQNSTRSEFARAYMIEQEEVARRSIREFVVRHAT
jgi:hypothetical protein